ncbi:hypothetical protein BC835DRAFT_1414489 [Cytidiella melzeri]|nr:hypothetical protein BC835DRAFT_1414489 [Cytidiella melzeri]
MNKTQYYFSQCAEAASKSPMCFTLGAVMVKGGKIISTGYNHYRTHYDGNDHSAHGNRKPVSMHAEMHAIYSLTGMSPSFKTQGPKSKHKQQRILAVGEDCTGAECPAALPPPVWQPGKGWDVRRREPRVNGADIYVARITKNGTGSAKPCWRCLEWCRWAGVKRVFHWNSEEGRFDVVKVNGDGRENYETRADLRLFAGLALR